MILANINLFHDYLNIKKRKKNILYNLPRKYILFYLFIYRYMLFAHLYYNLKTFWTL